MTANELPIEYRQVYEKLKGAIHTSSHGGLKNCAIEDIEAFAHHYLVALSTLSRMRANPAWHPYIPAFQRSLLQANILLYPEKQVTLGAIWDFIWVQLPAQLWDNRWYFAASTLICAICTVLGFLIVMQNFEMAPVFIPSGLRSSHEIEAYLFSNNAQQEMLTAGRDADMSEKALFATFLMQNNIKVAILSFITGFLFGLPTLLILVQTGLMLGALPALFYYGDLAGLGAWLLPHGVPEISAILFSSGAGLRLGMTMLEPRAEKLGTRLWHALRHVSGTIVLCVVLLIWAGLVESFVRQSDLSNSTRYAIAGVSVIPLVLVFLRAFLASKTLEKRREAQQAASY